MAIRVATITHPFSKGSNCEMDLFRDLRLYALTIIITEMDAKAMVLTSSMEPFAARGQAIAAMETICSWC